jgi:hypothetical protein
MQRQLRPRDFSYDSGKIQKNNLGFLRAKQA